MRFQRLVRDAGLLDAQRFSAADVDLLFMQTILKSGVPIEDANSAGMGFHEFCDGLLEVARRKLERAPTPLPGGDDAAAGSALAAALEKVVMALPGATVAFGGGF